MRSQAETWARLEVAVKRIIAEEINTNAAQGPYGVQNHDRNLVEDKLRAAKALQGIVSNPAVREAFNFAPVTLHSDLLRIRHTKTKEGIQVVANGILDGLAEPRAPSRPVQPSDTSRASHGPLRTSLPAWWIDSREAASLEFGQDVLAKSEGGFGTVSIVIWKGKTYASKKVSAQGSNNSARMDFEREMNLLWAVRRHQNTVDCYGGIWEQPPGGVGTGRIIMELVDGGLNLQQLVEKEYDCLLPLHKIQILYGIASAMAYCVRCNPIVIHSDLHPKNVLIIEQMGPNNQGKIYIPKVCDFGMGFMMNDPGRGKFVRMDARQCGGREGYRSPEKRISRLATKNLDVWGFGWTAFFLFTRKHPNNDAVSDDVSVTGALDKESPLVPPAVMQIIRECIVTDEASRLSFEELTSRLRLLMTTIESSRTPENLRRSPHSSHQSGSFDSNLPSYFSNGDPSMSSKTLTSFHSLSIDEVDPRVIKADEYYNAKQYEMAEKIYRELAAQDVPSAMQRLAKVYRETGNHPPDVSLEWTRRAAARGHISSMCRLGYSYEHGVGVRKSMSEAVFWYKKAAEAGHPTAKVNFAQCIQHGDAARKGTRRDAVNHLKEASEMGNPNAMYMYGMCLKEGDSVKKDLKAAFSYFGRAAQKNHPRAMKEYGCWLLHGGGGVQPNPIQGNMWIERSKQTRIQIQSPPKHIPDKKKRSWRG